MKTYDTCPVWLAEAGVRTKKDDDVVVVCRLMHAEESLMHAEERERGEVVLGGGEWSTQLISSFFFHF